MRLLDAEALALGTEENEAQEKGMSKMLRFLENYTRQEEFRNLKI